MIFNFFKKEKKIEGREDILKKIKEIEEKIDKISQKIETLERKGSFSVQKVGIIRYNPFSEIGGNQSFSIAFLDENDCGVLITSLYGRDGTRVYAKPIEKGESEYQLSEEEKEVIKKAQEKKK